MSANNEPDYNYWTRTRTPDPNTPPWERDFKEREDRELRHHIIKQVPASRHPIGPNGRTGEAGFPLDPVLKHHLGLPTGTIPTPTDQPDWSINCDKRFPTRHEIHYIMQRFRLDKLIPCVILDGVMTALNRGRLPDGTSIYQGDFVPPPIAEWEARNEISPHHFTAYLETHPHLRCKLPRGASNVKLDIPPHLCVDPRDSRQYVEPETPEAAPETPSDTTPAAPSVSNPYPPNPNPGTNGANGAPRQSAFPSESDHYPRNTGPVALVDPDPNHVAPGDPVPNPGTAAALTEKQRKVIELIHAGYSVSGAMEYVRMGRRTFYDWREASPLFKQATEAARENYRGTVSDGVHELQQSVRGLIENCIQSDNVPMSQRLRAASLFLRYVHAENMLPRPLARHTPPASPVPPIVNPSPEGPANSGAPATHAAPSAASYSQRSLAELFTAMAGPDINALDPYLDVLMAAPPPSAEGAPEAAAHPTHIETSDKPVRTVRSDLPSDTHPYPRNPQSGANGDTVPDLGANGDQVAPPTPGTTSPVPADPDILSQIPGLSPGHYLYDPSPAHTENSDQPVRSVRSALPSQSGHCPLATDHGAKDAPVPNLGASGGPSPSESETNPFSLNPKPGAEGAFPEPEEQT